MPVVLTPGAVWFGAVVAFAFLFTFDKAFRALFAPLMLRIANIGIGGTRITPGAHPFGFLKGIVEDVETWTRRQMSACERAMSWAIETMRATMHELSLTVNAMAENYKAAFDNVWHAVTHDAPQIIRQTVVRPVQKAATYSDAKLRAQVHRLTVRVDHLAAKIAHTATATAGAIAAPFPRIGRIEREAHDATKWLKKHRYLAAYTSLAALGLAILKRLGLGWLRCRNVNKAGKAVCGMNPLALEALLLTALPLAVDFDLEAFAEEMQTVTEEAASLIHKFAT